MLVALAELLSILRRPRFVPLSPPASLGLALLDPDQRGAPFRSRRMTSICAHCAFGPPAAPCRNAMLAVPRRRAGRDRWSRSSGFVVETMFFTAILWARFMFGLSRIACIHLGVSAGPVQPETAAVRPVPRRRGRDRREIWAAVALWHGGGCRRLVMFTFFIQSAKTSKSNEKLELVGRSAAIARINQWTGPAISGTAPGRSLCPACRLSLRGADGEGDQREI